MKIIYSDDHLKHAGGKELLFNEMVPQFEKPERMDMILKRIDALGYGEMQGPDRFDLAHITAVHDPDYIAFLSEAYALWQQEEDEGETGFAIAYTFAQRGLRQKPGRSVHSKLGYYSFDVGVPFVAGTWDAVKTSADVALTGQSLVQMGERAVFSLCRPPGHHAARDLAGGYCYVNNAAVAAQAFRDAGAARVAILDVDYHHGNGTQMIFYDRADVFFVSLHGDPEQEYPYFLGYRDETGAGAGEGTNHNYPLPWGTGWSDYGAALSDGIGKIRERGADALIVSLGVDTYKDDPISKFKLEHEHYLEIGAAIAALNLPTLFVMEGGYAVEAIGINAVNVLLGFEQGA